MLHDMRLEWIEDILAIAEAGSLHEAAARRHISQSAFSRRIRMIEERLGVTLFDRARKPLALTPHVAELRERLEQAAADLRLLVGDLQASVSDRAARVTIASQHALTQSLMPIILTALADRPAPVVPHLRIENQREALALLLTRAADLAFVYRHDDIPLPLNGAALAQLDLAQDRLIPVRAPHLGLPAGGALPVIGYPSDVFLGQVMGRVILPALAPQGGWRIQPQAETALTLAALDLALAGLGVAWLPLSLVAGHLRRGQLVSCADVLPETCFTLLALRFPENPRPAAAALWQWLAQTAPLTLAVAP